MRFLRLDFILGTALLLRLLWVLIVPMVLVSDPGSYTALAHTLLEHGVYGFSADQPIATWPPGTAAFYALIYALPLPEAATAQAANVAISVLNVWLTFLVGRRLFDDMTGRIAALAMALWPQMIFFTTLTASEPPFIALILGGVLAWDMARTRNVVLMSLVAGVLLALACYVRSVGLLLPVALAFGDVVRGALPLWRSVARLVLVVAAMAAVIAPWTLRNRAVFGETIVMSSNLGSNLYLGNAGGSTGRFGSSERPEEVQDAVEGLGYAERSERLGSLALQEIRDNPGAFLRRALDKIRIVHDRESIGVSWNRDALRPLVGQGGMTALKGLASAYWWVILAAGVVGLLWQAVAGPVGWRILFTPPMAVWGYFTAVHAVVLAADRFHMPQAAFVAMLGASCLAFWARRALPGHEKIPPIQAE